MHESDLPRLKQLYVSGRVSLPEFEAIVEYYFRDCGGRGPTVLGLHIPSSVDPDAPTDPVDHPGVRQYLDT